MTYGGVRRVSRSLIVVLVAVCVALPSPASARADRIVRRGACSGHSDWKLDVRRADEGRLRVTIEIEGGRPGQDWHIFLSDDGVRIYAGARTSGVGGHVEVRVRTTDRAGSDTVKAAANDVAAGETCRGRATL
jgi:hypothetical protein